MLKQWGVGLLTVEAIAALIQFLRLKISYHYSVFVGPGPFFWRGENPYTMFFVAGNDEQRYLYSPTFSMFYFFPFSRMSETWGRFAYVSLSLAVLVGGAWYWMSLAQRTYGIDFRSHPWRNVALAMVGAELFGAIYFCKVEMFEVGLLLVLVRMLVDKKVFFPFLLLGLLAEIKFQTVPVIGLLFVALLMLDTKPLRGAMTAGVAGLLGFLSGALLPLLAVSPATLLTWNKARFANIEHVITHYWQEHYQPLYKVLLTGGAGVTLADVRTFNAVGAIFFVALLVVLIRGWSARENAAKRDLGFLAAISFGLLFNLLCSPMSQTNAFIFFVPIIALIFALNPYGGSKTTLALLLGAFFLISIQYSDLVPHGWNMWARYWGLKPWGLVLLLAAVVKDGLQKPSFIPISEAKNLPGFWMLSQRLR